MNIFILFLGPDVGTGFNTMKKAAKYKDNKHCPLQAYTAT